MLFLHAVTVVDAHVKQVIPVSEVFFPPTVRSYDVIEMEYC